MNSIEFDSFTWPKNKGANEDSIVIGTHMGIHYFGVADGVGGSVGGGIASQVAVMQAEAAIKGNPSVDIFSIFESVHKKMQEIAAKGKDLQNMATTFTLCLVESNTLSVGHVGDSRLYVLKNNNITFKTDDQTLYNSLLSKGAERTSSHFKKLYSNILSSALCPSHRYDLYTTKVIISPGDRVVICSDGVHKVITDRELVEISVSSSSIKPFALKIKAVLRIRGIIDDSSLICFELK